MQLRLWILGVLGALVIAVAACGGAPAGGGEPAGVVTTALEATETGGLAKMADYTCAAQKANLTGVLGGTADLSQLTAMGIDLPALMAAMKLNFEEVKATETSKTADKATVHVTGKVTVSFDEASFRPIVKQILEAQGVAADDAMIDQMLTSMAGQLSQTQTLDEDLNLIQEGGKWVVCG
jgi:hypothetical protein